MKPNLLPPSPFVRSLSSLLKEGPLRILDVGCCQGRNALFLAGLGHHVVGLSLRHEDLIAAQNIGSQVYPEVQYVTGDARKLPFSTVFDVVLCNEVLHQIPQNDRKSVISGIQSVTRPGGVNIVSDYVGDNPNATNPLWLTDQYPLEDWQLDIDIKKHPKVQFGTEMLLSSMVTMIAVKR